MLTIADGQHNIDNNCKQRIKQMLTIAKNATNNIFSVLILDPNIYIELEALKKLSQELKKIFMHLVSSTPRLKFLDVCSKQETGNP